MSGEVKLGQELLLGAHPDGRFTPVIVTSIQRAQVCLLLRWKSGKRCYFALSKRQETAARDFK